MDLPEIPLSFKDKLKTKFRFWQKLAPSQKFSLALFLFFVLILPLSVLVTLIPVRLYQRAQVPATPPVIVTPTPALLNPIKWSTPQVYLQADDFYIIANGEKYFGKDSSIRVTSDPGNATYTTLETQWQENGREMRLYIYFNADNQKWWSPEIRTYGGSPPENWIYYYGHFFETPLGSEYKDKFVLICSDSQKNNENSGNIHFKNLRLQAFRNYITTPTPTAPPPISIAPNLYCHSDDKGVFTVQQYTRSDGYPGLKITLVSRTNYQNVALKFTQKGSDGYFTGNLPSFSSEPPFFKWYWDEVRPANPDFKIEFYINHTPSQNGEPCGEWYSYSPTPYPITPTPPPPPPICSIGLKEYYVKISCPSGYRYVFYTCTDGYSGQMGGSTSCKTTEIWKQYAYSSCKARCSPTPTLAPRPTQLPTPTISFNRPPVITTTSLPNGRIGRSYSATISGYDQDLGDTLEMSISNLPPRVIQGPCGSSVGQGKKLINCTISGKPTSSGTYNVKVTLRDNRGSTTQKTLLLRIY